MNEYYHVFKHGQKRGPFSLDDLLNEIESGRLDYEDFCLRIGASTCEKIRQTLDWEDSHLLTNSLADEVDSPSATNASNGGETLADSDEFESEKHRLSLDDDEQDPSELDDNPDCNEEPHPDSIEGDDIDPEAFQFAYDEDDRSVDEPIDDSKTPLSDYPEETYSDDDDNEHRFEPDSQQGYDEDFLSDEDDDEPRDGPPEDSTAILYSGRPSLLSYPYSLLLIALSLFAGIWLRHQFDWVLFAGLSLALIVFIQLQFRRSRYQYYITPRQVEVIHGLILESSREICIEDIGAIYIRQRGLQGLLGLATIQFAAAESPMPILVFHNIRRARRIKDLIRRLQDALE
ncbi:MAG: PH domain-containing protein [Verrucomicrobiota bacterium]